MAVYRTQDGDMLDDICLKYYGHTVGTVEQVLLANPHLADFGSVYGSGISITLPIINQATKASVIKLWD